MSDKTERLHELLDERGVEYESPHVGFTIVRADNAVLKFYESIEKPELGVFAVVTTDWLTPEQVISATLGAPRPTLPHFWTADGTLHVEPRRMPERVQAHLGGEDVTFERGLGTCHLEEIEKDCDTASEYMLDREWCIDAVYRCSCGCRFGHVAHNRPRFCPNCGARVEADE